MAMEVMKSIESLVNSGKLKSVRKEILFLYHRVLAELSHYTTKKDADYAAELLKNDLIKQRRRYDANGLRDYAKARAESIMERIRMHKENILHMNLRRTSDFYMLSKTDICAYIHSAVYFKSFDIRGKL